MYVASAIQCGEVMMERKGDGVVVIRAPAGAMADAPIEADSYYQRAIAYRELPDGRCLSLWPMLLGNTRLCIGETGAGCFQDGWCYHHDGLAIAAVMGWDGEGDPPGWFKHLGSGRTQPQYSRENG